jgi:hypothetical protein
MAWCTFLNFWTGFSLFACAFFAGVLGTCVMSLFYMCLGIIFDGCKEDHTEIQKMLALRRDAETNQHEGFEQV